MTGIGINVELTLRRLAGLDRFLRAAVPHLPAERLTPAQRLLDRAYGRLRRAGGHTVVALAGATGSGKSSLFNALAQMDLSPVGHLRPTTGEAHACVWATTSSTLDSALDSADSPRSRPGPSILDHASLDRASLDRASLDRASLDRASSMLDRGASILDHPRLSTLDRADPGELDRADALLDWLGVAPSRRFVRESLLDGEDQAALRGLVLLDLPDLDSVASGHRLAAERLIELTDLLIWVTDPQKYADHVAHERYLRRLAALRRVTVVVLNQTDRLRAEDMQRCLADLSRLLDGDGMVGVPVFATSVLTQDGLSQLRTLLERVVADRRAGTARLFDEVSATVAGLAPLVVGDVAENAITRESVLDLAGQLAAAAGVEAIESGCVDRYERDAAVPGRRWPRPPVPASPAGATVAPARVALIVRGFADRAAALLPREWSEAVRVASRRDLAQLPDELAQRLDGATAAPSAGMGWAAARALWWLCLLVTVGCAGWLARHAVFGSQVPGMLRAVTPDWLQPTVPRWVQVGPPGWLVADGVTGLALIPLVAVAVGRALAKRYAVQVRRRLADAAATVTRERVVAPVRGVLRAYAEARQALVDVGTSTPPTAAESTEPEPGHANLADLADAESTDAQPTDAQRTDAQPATAEPTGPEPGHAEPGEPGLAGTALPGPGRSATIGR
jgi:GTP-binding protein EngB required for normal cell division